MNTTKFNSVTKKTNLLATSPPAFFTRQGRREQIKTKETPVKNNEKIKYYKV